MYEPVAGRNQMAVPLGLCNAVEIAFWCLEPLLALSTQGKKANKLMMFTYFGIE